MPYVTKERRKQLDQGFLDTPSMAGLQEGDLNYIITKLCILYVRSNLMNYKSLLFVLHHVDS